MPRRVGSCIFGPEILLPPALPQVCLGWAELRTHCLPHCSNFSLIQETVSPFALIAFTHSRRKEK